MRPFIANILRLFMLIVCIGNFFIHFSLNLFFHFSVYAFVDHVYFSSPNGDMVSANVYYPRSPIQRPYPVIIYAHGLNQFKDLDLRIPVMMCQRGFAVISLDQSGHGHTFGRLRSLFWQNGIAALDYVDAHPSVFNTSAIGLTGHSLGGWLTLMCMTNDSRIQAGVTWAAPSNISELVNQQRGTYEWLMRNLGIFTDTGFFLNEDEYPDNDPITQFKILNDSSNPVENLLIIHGTNDLTVPYEQAVSLSNFIASSSNLSTITGASHALFGFEVIKQTISWFELKLLGVEQLPTVTPNDLLYNDMYFFFTGEIFWGFLSMGCLIFLIYYFLKDTKYINPEVSDPRGYKFVVLSSLSSLAIPFLVFGSFILIQNLLLSMILGSLVLLGVSSSLLLYFNRSQLSKDFMKKALKSQFHPASASVGFGIALIGILLVTCIGIVTNSFFVYPLSSGHYLLSLLYLLPVVISSEIFYRKVIQDNISGYRWIPRFFTCLLIFFSNILFMFLIFVILEIMFLAQIISQIMFLISSLMGTYLYSKTKRLDASVLSSLIFFAFGVANLYFYFPF